MYWPLPLRGWFKYQVINKSPWGIFGKKLLWKAFWAARFFSVLFKDYLFKFALLFPLRLCFSDHKTARPGDQLQACPDGGIPADAGQGPTRGTLLFEIWFLVPPGWWNGRHAGLKILWAVMLVRVQVPLRVQKASIYRGFPHLVGANQVQIFIL